MPAEYPGGQVEQKDQANDRSHPIAEYVMTFSVSISQRSADCVNGSNRINLPQICNRKSRNQKIGNDWLARS